jgi:O-antigen ligase
MVSHDSSLDRIYQYLLISAFFLLPLTVLGNNLAIWSIVIIWLFSGNYFHKFKQLKSNNLAIASIIFFFLHLISLLWTDNLSWGMEIVRKMLPFLLVLPIFLNISKIQNSNYYISAFLIAIAISETLSYLIWFGLIDPFKYATIDNPTPLMSHISYNPFIAFALYLVLNKLFSRENMPQIMRAVYTFFALTMTFNMFITAGRAGQIMFFFALIILAFQHFKNSQIKAILISITSIILISIIAYNFSQIFQSRVDSALNDILNYNANKNTSVGMRITFLINSFTLFMESPFLGVGAGDFPIEYERINNIYSPEVDLTVQPHNMYLLVLAQLGLIGLYSFAMVFFLQFKIAFQEKNISIHNIGIAMPLLFMVIMWSDSYLLGHYTSNLFILFSAFLYSNNQ